MLWTPKKWKLDLIRQLPGSSTKSGDPSLQHAPEEDRRVLTREDEVEDAERCEEVNDQARNNGHHVETELLCGHRQVGQLHDLSSYQAHNAERRVPTQVRRTQNNTCIKL